MKVIITITAFLCFLLDLLLIDWNFFGVFGCVGSIAIIISHILRKKEKLILTIGILLILIGLSGICFRERDSHINNYRTGINKVNEYLDKEKTEEALEVLDELEQSFGKREETIIARIRCHYVDGDYNEALSVAEDYPNKTTEEYYFIMEELYIRLEEEGEEKLDLLYMEAANAYPNWLHMQLSAVMSQLKNKEYNSARNYFERAYYLDYENGMASYLLGMTSYYMGDYRNCLLYFNEALEKGVSDEIEEAILNQVSIVWEDE